MGRQISAGALQRKLTTSSGEYGEYGELRDRMGWDMLPGVSKKIHKSLNIEKSSSSHTTGTSNYTKLFIKQRKPYPFLTVILLRDEEQIHLEPYEHIHS